MADKTIGSLSQVESLTDNSSFVCEDNGEAKRVTGKQIKDFAKQGVSDEAAAQIRAIQSAGDAQTQRVNNEGITQTANAKAQADAAAQSAAGAAQSAQQAAESAAVYGEVVADVTQLKADIVKHTEKADNFISSMNMFDYYSDDNKIGYVTTTGNVNSSNTTYKTSHFIRVEPNTTYYVLGFYKNSTYGYNFAPYLCEYGEDKSTVVLWSTDVGEKITTQPTTKYVRFSYRASSDRNRVGFSRMPFVNSLTKPYNPSIIGSKVSDSKNMVRFGRSGFVNLGTSGIINSNLVHSIRKNERIVFSGKISYFSAIEIGLKRGDVGTKTNRLVIDSTKVTAYNYDGTILGEYEHGLIITNNLQILCEVGFSYNMKLTISSNGLAYTNTNIRWERKHNCYLYVESVGSKLTDCRLSWTCTDLNKDVWMFGDSYFGYTNKWTYFFNKYGYANNVLMDSYGGKSSNGAIESLKTYLTIARPKIVIWCMGMNDGSDENDAPSQSWMSGVTELLNLSQIYDFKVVLSTIPSVPTINHEAKNAYVRESGDIYTYIDFSRGVGATSDGTWYGDMLSSDGVHPSNSGAMALFMQAMTDAPFLMIT